MAGEPVVVVPYDPEWPDIFEQERAALAAALAGFDLSIEHVGSTAVAGLAAKPIIDILIESSELPKPASSIEGRDEPSPMARAIESCGYLIGPSDGEYIRCFKKDPQCNLWIYPPGDPRAEKCLLLRDYLGKHRDVAIEYQELKQRLMLKYPNDGAAYNLEKQPLVDHIVDRARRP